MSRCHSVPFLHTKKTSKTLLIPSSIFTIFLAYFAFVGEVLPIHPMTFPWEVQEPHALNQLGPFSLLQYGYLNHVELQKTNVVIFSHIAINR